MYDVWQFFPNLRVDFPLPAAVHDAEKLKVCCKECQKCSNIPFVSSQEAQHRTREMIL
jgi:hypothetical protein